MSFSGARGNASQIHQLVGMRGLMSDPQGQYMYNLRDVNYTTNTGTRRDPSPNGKEMGGIHGDGDKDKGYFLLSVQLSGYGVGQVGTDFPLKEFRSIIALETNKSSSL
ncbi:hypothetical protein GW17_00021993 [Ensete ventricosum]|nr:hypothetical protein GW17_00021993 [Ensete ventricosum]RZS15764.1 hypothetical protein BHM03_00047647 [Ensete ventricosum]